MAYVYQHLRLDTNEVFYVGIGKKINRAYEKKGRRNKYWNNIVNKAGYLVQIIAEGITWEEACQKEKELIKYYGRKDLGTGSLVNMTDGGDGSINLSQEVKYKIASHFLGKKIENHWSKTQEAKKKLSDRTKGYKNPACRPEVAEKISKAKKGKKNPKLSEYCKTRLGELNAFYGKTHSDVSKQKMRELKEGVSLSEQHKINLSIAMKNRGPYDYKDKQKQCPHCGLIGGGGNMKRYHFDNCKSLQK